MSSKDIGMNIRKIKKLVNNPGKFFLDSKIVKHFSGRKKQIINKPSLGFIVIGSDAVITEDTIESINSARKKYITINSPHVIIENTDNLIDEIKDASAKINTDYIKIMHEGEILHVDFLKNFYGSINWDIDSDIILHSYTHDIANCQIDPLIGDLKNAPTQTGHDRKDYLIPISNVLIFKPEVLSSLEEFIISTSLFGKIFNCLNLLASSSINSSIPYIRGALTSNINCERLETQLQNTIKDGNEFLEILNRVEILLLSKNQAAQFNKSILCLIHNIVLLLLKNKKTDELIIPEKAKNITDKLFNIINLLGVDSLKSYSSNNYNHIHKIGYLQILGLNADRDLCYIEDVDTKNNRIKFKVASHHDVVPRLFLNQKEIIPLSVKVKDLTVFNYSFSYEIYFWLPYQLESHEFYILNEYKTDMMISGKRQQKSSIKNIINSHNKKNTITIDMPRKAKLLRYAGSLNNVKNKLNDSWIFIDNEIRADDNAEHFYRYVTKNHPNVNCYFLISKNSSDWERLKNEGFKLIQFGGLMHRLALLNAKYLLSSHANPAIVNYLPRKHYSDIMRYKFVFLQHGITKDDQSEWLNSRKIDFLVTAAQHEFKDISGRGRYRYTTQETVLTGFPRFDNLIANGKNNKQILIMPTWRKSLSGELIRKSSKRIKNPEFINSFFCKMWGEFLRSEQLQQLSQNYGYKIKFLPHPNITDYLDELDIPSYIEIGDLTTTSIQTTFINSDLLITDFSSVAFDVAYMNKPVIYFQFDSETFFSEHSYSKGYYDYESLGFGPVVKSISNLNSEIEKILSNECLVAPYYKQRIEQFFPYQDRNNSSRLFDVLNNESKKHYSIDTILQYIAMYIHRLEYKTALSLLSRFDNILKNTPNWYSEKLTKILNDLYLLAMLYEDDVALIHIKNTAFSLNIIIHLISDKISDLVSECKNIICSVENYVSSTTVGESDEESSIVLDNNMTGFEQVCYFTYHYHLNNYSLALKGLNTKPSGYSCSLPNKIEFMRCIALIKTGAVASTASLLKKVQLSEKDKELLLETYYNFHNVSDRHNLDIYHLIPNPNSSQIAIEAFLLLSKKVDFDLFNSLTDKLTLSEITLNYHIDNLFKKKRYSTIISILDNSRNLDIYLNNDESKGNYLTTIFQTSGIECFLSTLNKLDDGNNLTNAIECYFTNNKKNDYDIFYHIIESLITNDLYPFTCADIYKYALFLFNNSRPGLAKKLVTLSMMKKHEEFYTDKNNWNGDNDYKTLLSAISELNNAIQEFNRIA